MVSSSLLLLPYSIQLQHFEGYDTFQGGEKTQRSTIRNAGKKTNYWVDSRDWKEAKVGAVAVSMSIILLLYCIHVTVTWCL